MGRLSRLYHDLPSKRDERLQGFWEAEVLDNNDPDNEGKIKVCIQDICGDDPIENVRPMMPLHTSHLPRVGQIVFVFFSQLMIEAPFYMGAFWPTDKKPPGLTLKPNLQTYQLTDANNEPLLTIEHKDENYFVIKMNKANSRIEFKQGDKTINLWSDDDNKQAPVNINGEYPLTGQHVAREFDAVRVLNPFTGLPSKGVITEGSKRVIASNDKATDLPI